MIRSWFRSACPTSISGLFMGKSTGNPLYHTFCEGSTLALMVKKLTSSLQMQATTVSLSRASPEPLQSLSRAPRAPKAFQSLPDPPSPEPLQPLQSLYRAAKTLSSRAYRASKTCSEPLQSLPNLFSADAGRYNEQSLRIATP